VSDQVLHLVVPGLCGPPPRTTTAAGDDSCRPPRFATLERWLARADRAPVAKDPEALLFELFGLALPAQGDLPTAAPCYLADSGEAPEGVVFHADPVHLRPDQDRLLLFDTPAGDLTADEATAFVGAFNAHFQNDGWCLSAPQPGRWYLHVAQQPALRSHPLGEVIGRNIDLFLPEGSAAQDWRQRLNEVQMLFHGLTVNAEREASGRLAVNGLWLHGGGPLPAAPRRAPQPDAAAPPLLIGLRSLAVGADVPRVAWLDAPRRAQWDSDVAAWWAALADVEGRLAEAAAAGPVCLYPGDGFAYRYRPAHRWRVWRRHRWAQ
jgi:hypothetical protein